MKTLIVSEKENEMILIISPDDSSKISFNVSGSKYDFHKLYLQLQRIYTKEDVNNDGV